jgi:hypothetical protein
MMQVIWWSAPVIDLLMVKRFVAPPDFDVYKLHFEIHKCPGDHALLEDSTCFADELDGSKDLGNLQPWVIETLRGLI